MKYYIFDLDGTLADSMGYWYGSFREDERYDHERMQQVRLAMKEKYAEIIQPRPGALELLERLYSEGAVMCIASATDRWVSEPFMKKFGLDRFFRFYLDCTEAGAHKDKPDIFLQAAQRLGASIAECTPWWSTPPTARSLRITQASGSSGYTTRTPRPAGTFRSLLMCLSGSLRSSRIDC